MAVEWTIMIEGSNEFGDTCRKEVRIDKSWERLFDPREITGLGRSIPMQSGLPQRQARIAARG